MDQANNIDQTNDVDRSNTYSAWLCRVQLETQCEEDQAWPQLNSQNQGKHNSQRNEQHCTIFQRYVQNTNLDTCSEDSLDLSEYPELGDRRVKTKNRLDRIVLSPEIVMSQIESKEKHKRLAGQNRFKRTEKISFNFKRALEIAEYYALKNPKIPLSLTANIYRVNTNPYNKNSPNDKAIEIKKVKKYNIKPKNLSSLKRKILLERCFNRQRKRRLKKIEGNVVDVNSINFDTLKIKSDPEIDIDYIKRMSTLTVYDTDYRNSKEENIPEDTVQYRPDITKKLDDLWISNINTNISTTSYVNALDNTDDLNILQSALSLKSEDEVDDKSDIKPLFQSNELIKYSKNFREINISRESNDCVCIDIDLGFDHNAQSPYFEGCDSI